MRQPRALVRHPLPHQRRTLKPDQLSTLTPMSYTHPTASSSNFQLIFNNALKSYEKRTKKDLLAHPLAAQLQACDSSGAVLAILLQQIQELAQSRTTDERWSKWLDPTVNVLYACSATLGEGIGLVCLRDVNWLRCAPS